MNFSLLSDTSPKPWCNLTVNSIDTLSMHVENTIDAQDIDAVTTQTQSLLLDQNIVASVPIAGYSLIYADNTDRLNVASQTQPTQQIAYLSDVMLLSNEIISNDLSCNVKCSNGGNIKANINNIERININNDDTNIYSKDFLNGGGYGVLVGNSALQMASFNGVLGSMNIFSDDGGGRPKINLTGPTFQYQLDVFDDSVKIKSSGSERFLVDNTGIKINDQFYLPANNGSNGQVLTSNISGFSSWITPQVYGMYSATGAPVTVANSNTQNNIIPSGVGSLDIPANITPGTSYSLKAGGVFRDNINNTQFTFRLLNNLNTLFTSGLLTLTNITSLTPFNIDIQFTYMGGTLMVTNFKFSYNSGSSALGFVSQQENNTYDASIINNIGLTLQFIVANINNTLTCNFLTITKIF